MPGRQTAVRPATAEPWLALKAQDHSSFKKEVPGMESAEAVSERMARPPLLFIYLILRRQAER